MAPKRKASGGKRKASGGKRKASGGSTGSERLKSRCYLKAFVLKMNVLRPTLTAAHYQIIDKLPFAHFFYLNDYIKGEEELLDALVSSFSDDTGAFRIGDKNLYLTADEVSLILGLKSYGRPVVIEGQRSEIKERYLVNMLLDKENILRCIDIAVSRNDVDGVVKLLVLALFVSFLLPTTGGRIPPGLCKYVDDLDRIGDYAWGEYVYRYLMEEVPIKARAILQRQSGKGSNAGYLRGCTQVLQVWVKEHSPLAWRQTCIGGSPRLIKWEMKGKDYSTFVNLDSAKITSSPLMPLPSEMWLLSASSMQPRNWLQCVQQNAPNVEAASAEGQNEEKFPEISPLPTQVELLQEQLQAALAELKSKHHIIRAKDMENKLLKTELEKWRRGEFRFEEVQGSSAGVENVCQPEVEVKEKEDEEEIKIEKEEEEIRRRRGDFSMEVEGEVSIKKIQKFRFKTMGVKSPLKSPRKGTAQSVSRIGSPVKTVKGRDGRKKRTRYTPSEAEKNATRKEAAATKEAEVIDVLSQTQEITPKKPALVTVHSAALDDDHFPLAQAFMELSRGYYGADTVSAENKEVIDEFLNLTMNSEYVWVADDFELRRKDLWVLLFGGQLNDQVIHAYLKCLFQAVVGDPRASHLQFVFVPPTVSPYLYSKRQDTLYTLCPCLPHNLFRTSRFVIMAINTTTHWILMRIDYNNKTLCFWDSMQPRSAKAKTPIGPHQKYAWEVAMFLGMLLQDLYDRPAIDGFRVIFDTKCSQQPPLSQACGVYVLNYLHCILNDLPLTFTYDEAMSRRARFCADLLHYAKYVKMP